MDTIKLLEFDVIDKLLDTLPKDVNKIIFDFYDTRCEDCDKELIECEYCEFYFCQFHICFGHTSSCSVCFRHRCPYQAFYRICDCHYNTVCEKCWINDGDEADITPLTSLQVIDEMLDSSVVDVMDHIIVNLDNPDIDEITIDLIDMN